MARRPLNQDFVVGVPQPPRVPIAGSTTGIEQRVLEDIFRDGDVIFCRFWADTRCRWDGSDA